LYNSEYVTSTSFTSIPVFWVKLGSSFFRAALVGFAIDSMFKRAVTGAASTVNTEWKLSRGKLIERIVSSAGGDFPIRSIRDAIFFPAYR
jgi:hypothetical protein